VTQPLLHSPTRLRLVEALLAKLDKARSIEDYIHLRDSAAQAHVYLAYEAEFVLKLASYAARIEREAGELLRAVRGDA
jgi:hypothetical protein